MVNVITMKTKILLLLLLLSAGLAGYSATWQVTNSGISFSPSTITIQSGDDVNFTLDSDHNAVEVSAETWSADGSTSNGGFQVDFGGGLVSASQLGVGTHYYVCEPHASLGMKGTIIVEGSTAIEQPKLSVGIIVSPNPVRNLIQITVNENNLLGTRYMLFDKLGRQILNGKLTDKNISLTVNQLPSGMYFIQVASLKNGIYKVVLQN